MPFLQQPIRSFTRTGISEFNPNQYGVYGIFNQDRWIYIGKGDIRKRLLAHLNGDNPCILKAKPTHFVAEVTQYADAREKQLIQEMKPSCNVQLT